MVADSDKLGLIRRLSARVLVPGQAHDGSATAGGEVGQFGGYGCDQRTDLCQVSRAVVHRPVQERATDNADEEG